VGLSLVVRMINSRKIRLAVFTELMEAMRNSYNILVRKVQMKGPFWRQRYVMIVLKCIVKKQVEDTREFSPVVK
jgi:hypothetical protein